MYLALWSSDRILLVMANGLVKRGAAEDAQTDQLSTDGQSSPAGIAPAGGPAMLGSMSPARLTTDFRRFWSLPGRAARRCVVISQYILSGEGRSALVRPPDVEEGALALPPVTCPLTPHAPGPRESEENDIR